MVDKKGVTLLKAESYHAFRSRVRALEVGETLMAYVTERTARKVCKDARMEYPSAFEIKKAGVERLKITRIQHG